MKKCSIFIQAKSWLLLLCLSTHHLGSDMAFLLPCISKEVFCIPAVPECLQINACRYMHMKPNIHPRANNFCTIAFVWRVQTTNLLYNWQCLHFSCFCVWYYLWDWGAPREIPYVHCSSLSILLLLEHRRLWWVPSALSFHLPQLPVKHLASSSLKDNFWPVWI